MTTYNYTKTADFPGGIAPGQLDTEIRNSAIATILDRVDTDGDDVFIIFVSALSAGDQTLLDNLVSAHVPAPNNVRITSDAYIDIESTLADGQAITINASNAVGGIAIDAGNGISIQGGAACEFSSSGGGIVIDSSGVLDLVAGGGFNIGANAVSGAINIGTGASPRQIEIGNVNTTTYVNLKAGTLGINLDSMSGISLDSNDSSNFTLNSISDGQDLTISLAGATDSSIIIDSAGTGADALRFRTDGGMDIDATNGVNIATGVNSGGAITLDASFNNGGITLSAGNMGIAVNSFNGTVALANWSPANVLIGTASGSNMTIGNTSNSSTIINSGAGGINIGGNSSPGEVNIGNTDVAKSIFIGNSVSGSRLFARQGAGGFFKSQPSPIALSDSNNAIGLFALLAGVITGSPTADRIQTLPDASVIVSSISSIQVSDSFDFVFINKSSVSDAKWIISVGVGGTMEGSPDVSPAINSGYRTSGSGLFRLRMDNISSGVEAYTVYRIS